MVPKPVSSERSHGELRFLFDSYPSPPEKKGMFDLEVSHKFTKNAGWPGWTGGPCWLQHLFWPWTALTSAWACALPHLGLKPLKSWWWLMEHFFFPKKQATKPTWPPKKHRKTESLLWFFPILWDFSTSRNRWVSGLTRCMVHALGPLGLGGQFAHTMLGPQQWAHACDNC